MKRKTRVGLLGSALGAAVLVTAFGGTKLDAADHVEAPGSTADPLADLTDFYAFHDDAANTLTTVVNFNPLLASGTAASYSRDVLYTVHIDNDDDEIADIEIDTRFGADADGNWGVKVENLPGAYGDVTGDVESIISRNDAKVFVGLRDDPFFFDLDGYSTTLSTGTLSFDNTRDSFAGTNVQSIVLQMDLDMASDGNTDIQVWATTSRIQ